MKRLTNITRTSAIAAAIVMALPAGTWAQSSDLEEIVVTARKRDESVFEIPLSVTAFSQQAVDALGINTLESLSNFTPGFQFQNVGQGGRGGRQNPNIRFRGVGVQNENPSSRAGAVFWDGTYLSDGAGILPLIDLQRVEVIKGPQNAYFGRNTFAGAVNYVPALPGDELNGKVLASYSGSDEDSYNVTAAIGGPITETIGARIGVMTERVGADYTYRNGEPIGEEDTRAATFVATWTPTEDFFFKVSAFVVESEDTRTSVSQVAPVAPGDCNRVFSGNYRSLVTGQITGSFSTDLSQSPRSLFCGTIPDWDTIQPNTPAQGTVTPSDPLFLFNFGNTIKDYQDLPKELSRRNFYIDAPNGPGNTYRLWRYNLSADYNLPNEHVLSFAFARGESVSRGIFDNNFGTPSPVFGGNLWLTGVATWVRDTFAEIRLTSGSDQRLRYMIGVSSTEQDNELAEYSAFAAPVALNFESGDNVGIFGSLDYDFTDKVTVSLEGRWNDDEQIVLYDGTEGVDPNPITNLGRSYSAFMPRAIVAYQPTEAINLYASYA
jgi:iron complex outermembrane receptor protein